jgi:hypothetical protein
MASQARTYPHGKYKFVGVDVCKVPCVKFSNLHLLQAMAETHERTKLQQKPLRNLVA